MTTCLVEGSKDATEVNWDTLLDIECTVLAVTGQHGVRILQNTLLENCRSGRRIRWFSKGINNEDIDEGLHNHAAFEHWDLDQLDEFILNQKCAVESFDSPPTTVILDETVDIGHKKWVNFLKDAPDLNLTVLIVSKDATSINPSIMKAVHHIVMCRGSMTRKERRTCFDQITRKAVKPVTEMNVAFLEKATSARRFRRGPHAAVLNCSKGSVARIPLVAM